MQVDWFTLIAQVVNFAILLLLLRVFLYKPVSNVMARREQRIAAEQEEAQAAKAEAEQQGQALRAELEALHQQRQQRFEESEQEVEARRQELMTAARHQVDERRLRWHQALGQEQDETLEVFQQGAARLVSSAVRNALADLANLELEEHMLSVFCERLRQLDDDQRRALSRAITAQGSVTVLTSKAIPSEHRQELEQVIRAQLATGAEVRFEADRDRSPGIVLEALDYRLGWSLQHYLAELERTFEETLVTTRLQAVADAREVAES